MVMNNPGRWIDSTSPHTASQMPVPARSLGIDTVSSFIDTLTVVVALLLIQWQLWRRLLTRDGCN